LIEEVAYVGTLVCLAYMLCVFALYSVLIIFSALDNFIRSRETLGEDFALLAQSRFTIPLSVIVPAFNEQDVVSFTVQSILAFDYPELEVIVVDDGSTDDTFGVLERMLDLEPYAEFERRIVDCAPVRGVYASRSHPHVRVVRKDNQGTKADALNCGLNFARYRYVCTLDGDTLYEPDALLNAMRLVVRDPERIVGLTGHISVSSNPEGRISHQVDGHEVIDATLLSNFQHLDYLRAFLNNRLAWSRLGFMLCASGAFAIWRRDILEEVRGWSTEFSSEDIELTFRVHELMQRTSRPYRILSIPEMVARTEAPTRIGALVAQRARWQRVTLETLWHYRRMIGNPRYGVVGLVGVPLLVVTEALAPVFELLGIAALFAGLALGTFSWELYLVFFASMSFALAILTSAAVLLEDISTRAYRLRHLVRLIALGPVELLVYRPILVWARLKGTAGFLRGRRDWDKFDRNVRAPAESPT
jgi:cellulose synthase/poly-beta-1,6-N-acetylglucosamine synthase-like glycosyltransferase